MKLRVVSDQALQFIFDFKCIFSKTKTSCIGVECNGIILRQARVWEPETIHAFLFFSEAAAIVKVTSKIVIPKSFFLSCQFSLERNICWGGLFVCCYSSFFFSFFLSLPGCNNSGDTECLLFRCPEILARLRLTD